MDELYASELVKIYQPRGERIFEEGTFRDVKPRARMGGAVKDILKRHGVALIGAVLLIAWTLAACLITANRVREKTTAEVTAELRRGFQTYLEQQEAERNRATGAALLTGEASLEATIDAEAEWAARWWYGYVSNGTGEANAETGFWCVLMRADNTSGMYPNTVEGVVRQEGQWQFYSDGNPVRQADKEKLKEILRQWHRGEYPDGLTTSFVFMEWTQNDVVLRDRWEKDSSTNYWRFK